MLYLIEILHQTTTYAGRKAAGPALYLIEILHQTTTLHLCLLPPALLYLIEILHQTTTKVMRKRKRFRLYLIEILHQTTTPPRARACLLCCILSKFYIKPQLAENARSACAVVSYRNSTSNHNFASFIIVLS